jgi:hypothetical protein
MTRIPCTKCGTPILDATAKANGGICGPCARGAGFCVVCGDRVWEPDASGEFIHEKCARKRINAHVATDFDRIEQALYDHGIAALKRIRAARPNDRIYSIAFYTSGEFGYAFLTAASYEGLEDAVASYLGKPFYANADPWKLRRRLKWSPCDSPLHGLCEDVPGQLDPLIVDLSEEYRAIDDDAESKAFVGRVESTFISALRRLDMEGQLGTPEERAGIVLNLLKGDQSDEERVRNASLLNSPEIASAYTDELAMALES